MLETEFFSLTHFKRNIREVIIDEINNIQIHAKYSQMAFRLARWRCVWEFLGNTQSNKSDANVEDSDCTVRMLLFISIAKLQKVYGHYSRFRNRCRTGNKHRALKIGQKQ